MLDFFLWGVTVIQFLMTVISLGVVQRFWLYIVKIRYRFVYTIAENIEDIENWCKENKIDVYYFYKVRIPGYFWPKKEFNYKIGLKRKDEAMMFKLRWL